MQMMSMQMATAQGMLPIMGGNDMQEAQAAQLQHFLRIGALQVRLIIFYTFINVWLKLH